MIGWLHDHAGAAFGAAGTAWIASVSLPVDVTGLEKLGSLAFLGLFMLFTLLRLEGAIKENSKAVTAIADAMTKLSHHIEKLENK